MSMSKTTKKACFSLARLIVLTLAVLLLAPKVARCDLVLEFDIVDGIQSIHATGDPTGRAMGLSSFGGILFGTSSAYSGGFPLVHVFGSPIDPFEIASVTLFGNTLPPPRPVETELFFRQGNDFPFTCT